MENGRPAPLAGGVGLKNDAHPINDEAGAPGTGAPIVTPGGFPMDPASVTAEVLARMLAGEKLTSLSAVTSSRTTRLAVFIHRLYHHYGWVIQRNTIAAGCRDGRVSWVTEYSIAPELAALAVGREEWCGKVMAARAELREEAAAAKKRAETFNAFFKKA